MPIHLRLGSALSAIVVIMMAALPVLAEEQAVPNFTPAIQKIVTDPGSLGMTTELAEDEALSSHELFKLVRDYPKLVRAVSGSAKAGEVARNSRRAARAFLALVERYARSKQVFHNEIVMSLQAMSPHEKDLLALADRQQHALETGLRGLDITFNGLVPVYFGSSVMARRYWSATDAFDIAPSVAVAGGDKSGTVTATLLRTFVFGFRTSITSAVASTATEDAVRPNAQKLLEAGGNLALGVEFPLATYGKRDVFLSNEPTPSLLDLRVVAAPRAGLSHPSLGGSESESAANLDLGVSAEVRIGSDDRDLFWKLTYRAAHVWGNDVMERGLGVEDHFGYQLVTLMLEVNKQFGLAYSAPVDAPRPIRDALKGTFTVRLGTSH